MAFLKSACRNYRLPFDEQLLVHVQRPDATAVLQMEDWNRKFGRWVKRDSKGIVVIDKNAKTMRLKHYFDISDTQEGRYRRLVRPRSFVGGRGEIQAGRAGNPCKCLRRVRGKLRFCGNHTGGGGKRSR